MFWFAFDRAKGIAPSELIVFILILFAVCFGLMFVIGIIKYIFDRLTSTHDNYPKLPKPKR